MGQSIRPEQLADEVMKGLKEYADLAADEMKKEVKKAGTTAKNDITATAPKRTGKYAKSWRSKTTKENSSSVEVTVYSPTRYMLAHLLEHGHAKRGGGRVAGKPHIAPAEQKAIQQLEDAIRRALE